MEGFIKQLKYLDKKPTVSAESAILDKDLNIIKLDKLFSMQDIKYFFETLTGKKQSLVFATIPKNEVMISSKWKYQSRTYHPVNLNSRIKPLFMQSFTILPEIL